MSKPFYSESETDERGEPCEAGWFFWTIDDCARPVAQGPYDTEAEATDAARQQSV